MDECQNEIDFLELEKLCSISSDDAVTTSDMGQSESKKSSKKAAAAGLETKGTAMSFGFMHKHKTHHASSKGTSATDAGGGDGTGPGSGTGTIKKGSSNAAATTAATAAAAGTNGNHLLEKEKATERDNATVISNPGVDGIFSDKNGNMGLASDDKSSATGRSTPRLQPPKKDSHGAPYRNNRFGFRSTNVVRPASVGLQPKTIAADHCDKQQHSNGNNNNNIHTTNNNNVYITDKRRSKSASSAASARTTFTPVAPQQAPPSGQQHQHQDRHFGALPKPQPKYHHAAAAGSAPKIASSEAPSTTAKGNLQQVMTKCDQPEHKNTNQQHNPPSSASSQFGNGNGDEHRPQSSVNNANGPTTRQSVSFACGQQQQQHVAANSLTKTAQEVVAAKFTLHSSSLPKPQYPVPISLPSTTAPSSYAMDAKGAKQAVNISRKGTLQRELSGDPDEDGSVDSSPNIRMPRQRLRNLEMVMSGRHKFEVRDLETLTAEPIVALPLPKLPSAFNTNGQQQQPVPLSGLVRSSELPCQLSDDIDINDNRYESEQLHEDHVLERKDSITSSDVESLEEEKLMRDNNSSEKSLKGALIKDPGTECSKTSSPGSSRASWCNAGETMAAKDGCSSLSLSSSDEDNLIRRAAAAAANNRRAAQLREEEDISSMTVTAGNPSLMSSLSAAVPMDMSTNLDSISEAQNSFTEQDLNTMSDEPDNNIFRTEETKFAEMAAAVGDAILLDDETSPTDSLVSSCTESDDARKNRKKVAEGKVEKEKEKDIDEISPELEELTSPVTPGTPTHASNSLSLSDNGRDFLIDDEIADQPALLFDEPAHNDSSMIDLASIHLNLNEDTPTLKDSVSSANNNNRSASRNGAPVPKPRKIMSDVYESPAPLRKNRTRLSRAESLDTLSPCDSITSDDFMLDFNSSMDSINGPPRSNASGSASGLHSMDELQLWSELEGKGGQLMHEWSKLLRSQRNSNNNTSRESITSQLPARATRLLTRRLQNNATPTNCGGTGGSDSPRSMDSLPRRTAALSAAYKTATLNQFNNNSMTGSANGLMSDSASTISNSAEDLSLLDKSLRNSMLQDVVHFKKQLVRLRRILQETDTLNPFENNNGQFFTTATATNGGGGVEGAATGATGGPSSVDSKQQENTLIKESLALLEDQRFELADLRRQVVYLQGEITAKDRTIRQQQNLIEKYEAEREKGGLNGHGSDAADKQQPSIDTISTATQTERLRPLSFGGPEGLASRSEPPSPSHGPAVRNGLRSPATNHHLHQHHPPAHHNGSNSGSPSATSLALATPTSQRSGAASFNLKSATPKTQISSVYTQLSSIKHSTHNGTMAPNGSTTTTMATMAHHKRSSLGASNGNLCSSLASSCNGGGAGSPNKTVRTTHIGNVLTSNKLNHNGNGVSAPGSPTPPSAVNGSKLLKTSIRTQSPRQHPVASPKRTSAIKPPSSFGASTFPDTPPASKSKSAPATPIVERVPVQIVIDAVGGDGEVSKEDRNNNSSSNGHNGADEDVFEAGEEDKEHSAETEKDAIHNKINSLKLANGLTGCNDSSCKESSLVN